MMVDHKLPGSPMAASSGGSVTKIGDGEVPIEFKLTRQTGRGDNRYRAGYLQHSRSLAWKGGAAVSGEWPERGRASLPTRRVRDGRREWSQPESNSSRIESKTPGAGPRDDRGAGPTTPETTTGSSNSLLVMGDEPSIVDGRPRDDRGVHPDRRRLRRTRSHSANGRRAVFLGMGLRPPLWDRRRRNTASIRQCT